MGIDVSSKVPGQVLNLSFGQNQAKALRKFINLAMDNYGDQQSLRIVLNDRTLNFTDLNGGTSGIRLNTDGSLQWYRGTSGAETVSNLGFYLASGTTTGLRARWTNVTGVLSGGTVAAGTWQSLSSLFQVFVSEFASGQTETCVGILEIDNGTTVLASARITLTAVDV
jgi:hypothetical protein